jgi:hypothetical protein
MDNRNTKPPLVLFQVIGPSCAHSYRSIHRDNVSIQMSSVNKYYPPKHVELTRVREKQDRFSQAIRNIKNNVT